jgi:hypothetical protein
MPLASGGRPPRNAARTPRVSSGKLDLRASRFWVSCLRFAAVSATSKTTMLTPPSRHFRAIRRSRAWMSTRRISASTPTTTEPSRHCASQARRSPGIGNGTSVRQATLGGSCSRKRRRSRSCPESLTGSPSGYARALNFMPTEAHAAASWETVTLGSLALSIRPNVVSLMPTEAAAVRMLVPEPRRVSRISAPVERTICSACLRPRSARRSRVAISRGCHVGLICDQSSSGWRINACRIGFQAQGNRWSDEGAPTDTLVRRPSAVRRLELAGVRREAEPHLAGQDAAVAEV